MFKITDKCSKCGKEIQGNEEIYVKMRYPERKGMAEIKAYLQNEGEMICEKCLLSTPIKNSPISTK
ncbi:Fe3+ hydroxamate ABC transporter substrate-binding protein [Bacillus smithii]|uniref:Fe3+ hydroxamate ABC transporter substrate-binding protein n=1 Tax=Bacillus smithii TaxID=1479 RepID=UPI002E1DBD19|nr:Fe3+ hydroxamate ABC transporter substrate-binding protein [Bacillus smithii]MED1456783.1 Fe3+ hydroxamate ABC transporter substrate-binding protein [Bacillus smithii]